MPPCALPTASRTIAAGTAAGSESSISADCGGAGPAFAQRLAEKGLETVEDLLWCLPRRYDDVRDAKSLAAVEQQKLERYQQRYEEYVRTAKALQALLQ